MYGRFHPSGGDTKAGFSGPGFFILCACPPSASPWARRAGFRAVAANNFYFRSSVEDAAQKLKHLPFEDVDYAHIDHHRSLRKGFPEVIFGQEKTADQIVGIMEKMTVQENIVLVTRIDELQADRVVSRFPDAVYHKDAKMVILKKDEIPIRGKGTIVVISAGTSDIPIAKEASLTAQVMGNHVESVFDVGVAGIHRLFDHKNVIDEASVLVVVAGMEGALPSVVAGMVSRPVIAVSPPFLPCSTAAVPM